MTKAEDQISLSSLRSTCLKLNGLPPARGWRCDSAQLKRPSVRRLWRRFVTSRGSLPLTRLLDQTGKEPNNNEKTLAGNAVRVATRIIDHAGATRPGSVDGLRPYRLHSARQVRNKRALEWSEKVRHYQTLFTNAVEQLTTLGGVLERVDKELAKDKELARLTNDISDIIRGSRKLKNQIENQTRYQIAALQRIDSRVRNGIFDPEQDLQDLENYLLYSMGRNSKQTLRRAVNTAN